MSATVKDVSTRALKTFWQACIAYILASNTVLSSALTGTSTWDNALITLGVGGAAAGMSAIWNAFIKPLLTDSSTDSTAATALSSIAESISTLLSSDELKAVVISKLQALLAGTAETKTAETTDTTESTETTATETDTAETTTAETETAESTETTETDTTISDAIAAMLAAVS